MKSSLKWTLRKSLGIAVMVIAAAQIGSTLRAGTVFKEDFQSGNLTAWEPADVATQTTWKIVSDPDSLDNTQKVLSTPDMSTQTYLWHTLPAAVPGAVELSFRFDEDQSNHEWNTFWSLFTDPILNGAYRVNGYGMRLGYDAGLPATPIWISLSRFDAGPNGGKETGLGKTTLPADQLQAGWNTVKFRWDVDGTLTVWLNGQLAFTKKDATYPPSVRVIHIANFIANNNPPPASLPTGRRLFFDDVLLEQPEVKDDAKKDAK